MSNTELLLNLTPELEREQCPPLITIPLSTALEITNPEMQPVASREWSALGNIACQYPACQANGKVCTAQC